MPIAAPNSSYTLAYASSAGVDTRVLTQRERRDYDRLPHAARRRDWLVGRLAAKRAIAARFGERLSRIGLESRSDAAPECKLRMGAAWVPFPLAISVAHCDGVAVSAVADPGTRIGVDIDRASAIPPEQRRYFVAPSEESTTSADTTLLWVLKEAAWKALGLSASLPFTSLQLVFDSALETVEALRVDGACVPARTHVIRLMQPHELLVAVVEVVK